MTDVWNKAVLYHFVHGIALLVLAFLAGSTQREPRRAVALGLVCTFSALLGYGLMTLSPVENAHLTGSTAAAFVRSESPPGPDSDMRRLIVMDWNASRKSVFVFDQRISALASMLVACTPVPVVVTSTLPEASRFSRSVTFSTASVAVGAQTPPEQFMF